MASSNDAFLRVLDIRFEEESFYAPDDDDDVVLTLLHPTKNIPEPPPLPCITYQRFRATTRPAPSSLSRLVPREAVETWDKLFKEGFGADTYVITDNKSWFPAHSSVLVSSLFKILKSSTY